MSGCRAEMLSDGPKAEVNLAVTMLPMLVESYHVSCFFFGFCFFFVFYMIRMTPVHVIETALKKFFPTMQLKN